MREVISVFKDFLDTTIFRNESKQFEILLYKAKEAEKEVKTISQVQKQIFRTICWELKEIDGNIKAQKKFFSIYAQRRNEIFYTYLSDNHLDFKHIDFSILNQHDKFLRSWSNFEK